jgi:alanine racemase
MPLADAGAPPMAMTAFDVVNRAELDLGAIAHNTREIGRLVGPERRIVACLKSNAHGFGLMEVATTVLAAGADAVAIVNLGDAVCLREGGVSSPIMLYAGMIADERTAAVVDELDLMPTVLDLKSAGIFSAQAKREVRCLVKVDVGLQRLGLDPREVVDFVRELVRLPRIVFHGLYTHMHVIGGAAAERYLNWQFQRFTDVVAALERAGLPPPLRLAASSSVLALSTAMNLNAVDPGRLFYGLLPPTEALGSCRFRPAFRRLSSRLVQVKPVVRPAFADLAPFPVREGLRMGIAPIGRSDGMEALAADHVLVGGRRAPILMRPSLEHTRIDLTDIPGAAVGDEVVIIGRQGEAEITPADVTGRLAMDPGELAVGLRGSIERWYQYETPSP